MASFIYVYSKFTEEFLLLSSAGMFSLLAIYCYHWVVKKRRLGAARNQIPAGMVKIYLNQLINEAQFVRTQLFGLVGGEAGARPSGAKFQMPHFTNTGTSSEESAVSGEGSISNIPSDLMERLKALEVQLTDKESMVININVEKAKLLEEVENLKQNQAATQGTSPAPADNIALLTKMKSLEERLEEYALFEDDLANLKRLQQENATLKKRIGEIDTQAVSENTPKPAPKLAVVPKAEPLIEPTAKAPASPLDKDAIDALLDGATPTPVDPIETPESEAMLEEAIQAKGSEKTADEFEKLIDSVETSLTKEPSDLSPIAAKIPSLEASPATEAKVADSSASKSDEELLKEFESLLNS